jgi:CheY-like chemotaxis protein
MFTLNVSDGAGFASRQPSASKAARLRILIVEDDEADAYLIKRLLAEYPRIEQVVRAVDGVEALEMLQVGVTPDLAFIDLKMPRMDGFKLITEITKQRRQFPMVVLTSLTSISDTTRRALRRADQILSKPDNVIQMRSLIAKAIGKLGE